MGDVATQRLHPYIPCLCCLFLLTRCSLIGLILDCRWTDCISQKITIIEEIGRNHLSYEEVYTVEVITLWTRSMRRNIVLANVPARDDTSIRLRFQGQQCSQIRYGFETFRLCVIAVTFQAEDTIDGLTADCVCLL